MKIPKHILYIFAVILLSACSAQNIVKSDSETDSELLRAKAKKVAELHVIEGALYDLKGEFAEAILEYQEALSFDSSAGIHYALGRDYFRLKKFAPALSHSKSAVDLDSLNNDYKYLLAGIYTSVNLKDSSIAVYHSIIKNDSSEYQAYFNIGSLIEEKKPLEALNLYKALLNKIGPEWNVLVKVADLNERMGNVDETIKTVGDLLNLDPSNLQLRKLLIESLIKVGKADEAIENIDNALLSYPGDLNLIEFKAHAYITKDEWEKAADEYLKIVYSKDLPSESKLNIGKAFAAQATLDSTIVPIAKNILTAIDSLQDDWQIKAFLGEIAEKENKDTLAINYFSKAADLASWNSQIWVKLGILMFDNQMYADASKKLSVAVENFPDEFLINIILGLSFAQMDNHKEAEPFLAKSVRLNPTDLNALTAYAFTLNQLKKDDVAILYLDKALAIDPQNIQVLGTLGMIYDGKENWEKCDYYYEKAIAIDSTDALVLNNYAYSLSERGIQLERALEMSKKSIAEDPENSSYLDTIGWIYFKLGKYDLALKNIKKSIEKEPKNGTLLDHLGDVYFKMGDKKSAMENWERALELDSSLEKTKIKIETGEL